jgi:hypothetical protein
VPDLDHLFQDMRADVVSGVSGPAAGKVARIGRTRRARRRALGAGAVAAVLAGALFLQPPHDGRDGPAVRPAPTVSALPRLTSEDLTYWPEAERDDAQRWTITEDLPHLGFVLPGCSDRDIEPLGWTRQLGLEFSDERGERVASPGRNEVVVVFSDALRAESWLNALRSDIGACRRAPSPVDVGDEGYRVEAEKSPGPGKPFHITDAVFFRRGPVVGIYTLEESRESGRTGEILEDLEKDARRLSDRLCERGFGC